MLKERASDYYFAIWVRNYQWEEEEGGLTKGIGWY
jgi:hypothetical protein